MISAIEKLLTGERRTNAKSRRINQYCSMKMATFASPSRLNLSLPIHDHLSATQGSESGITRRAQTCGFVCDRRRGVEPDLRFRQGPLVGPQPVYTGRIGETLTQEDGYKAARLSAKNALAALDAEIGLDRVMRIVKLTGWVSSAPDFYFQHLVIDGASDLLIEVFGETGLHTRCALGVHVLPFNIPVEIELVAALKPEPVRGKG